jgi:hypothetical protein
MLKYATFLFCRMLATAADADRPTAQKKKFQLPAISSDIPSSLTDIPRSSLADIPSSLTDISHLSLAEMEEIRLATQIVSVDERPSPAKDHHQRRHYFASAMPIYQTATFKQESATEMGDFDYTRSGNPTRLHLGKSSDK